MVRKLMVLTGVFAALLMLPVAAHAQEYPPSSGDLEVPSDTAEPGGAVTISGSGYAPNTTVTITVNGVQVATVTTDGTGAFTATITLPTGVTGDVEIAATGTGADGETRVLSATVTVAGDGSTLPRTGSSGTFPAVGMALVLLCMGAAFVVATRRRGDARARTPLR